MEERTEYSFMYRGVSAAFEKLWHNGLLKKCQRLVLRGSFTIPSDHISDRRKVVVVGEETFDTLSVTAGVPQRCRLV